MPNIGQLPTERTNLHALKFDKLGIYLAAISWKENNPIHYTVLHVGLGTTYSYVEAFCMSYEENIRLQHERPYFLEVVHKLGDFPYGK